MLLKFDNPISLEKAQEIYSDKVKFISSTDSYPNITAVEFDCDPKFIFKREAIQPKVTKKVNKIIAAYEKKISQVWDRGFKSVIGTLTGPHKEESFEVSESKKKDAKEEMGVLIGTLIASAEKPFTAAYKLGQMRGQILSGQEVDDELSSEDDAKIESLLSDNEEYLVAFSEDLQNDLNSLMDEPYENPQDLEDAMHRKIEIPKKSRALMYSLAVLGAVVAGTILALKAARPEEGEKVIEGGIWTLHPEEGLGGEVCKGCEENAGHWFDLDDFWNEYGTNDCISNCRCDLRYSDQRIAP